MGARSNGSQSHVRDAAVLSECGSSARKSNFSVPSLGQRVRRSFAAHKGKIHGSTGGVDGWGDHYLLEDRTQEASPMRARTRR